MIRDGVDGQGEGEGHIEEQGVEGQREVREGGMPDPFVHPEEPEGEGVTEEEVKGVLSILESRELGVVGGEFQIEPGGDGLEGIAVEDEVVEGGVGNEGEIEVVMFFEVGIGVVGESAAGVFVVVGEVDVVGTEGLVEVGEKEGATCAREAYELGSEDFGRFWGGKHR